MSDLYKEAKLLTDKIVEDCHPVKVILYGSAARGDYKDDADIDLLVIKNSSQKRAFRVKEIFEAIRGLKRDYPLDTIVYTPDEFNERLSLGDYFIKRIIAEGKVLYG